jgi:hypothetical protein
MTAIVTGHSAFRGETLTVATESKNVRSTSAIYLIRDHNPLMKRVESKGSYIQGVRGVATAQHVHALPSNIICCNKEDQTSRFQLSSVIYHPSTR